MKTKLISLLIFSFLLAGCIPTGTITVEMETPPPVMIISPTPTASVPTAVPVVIEEDTSPEPLPTPTQSPATPAPTVEPVPGCDASFLENPEPLALVATDSLNLRAGPGQTYKVLSTMDFCQGMDVLGRDARGEWVAVQLPGHTLGGWAYAEYLQMNVALGTLPLATASGGPVPTEAPPPGVWVVIENNIATVTINDLDADAAFTLTLYPKDKPGRAVQIAQGKTDANGHTTLSFTMPATWANGTQVRENQLTLVLDFGETTMEVPLQYFAS